MAQVRIAVTAAAAGDLGAAFDPFIVSARRAQNQVRREIVGTSAVTKREMDRAARDAARANEQSARLFRKGEDERVRIEQRASQERVRIQKREFDEKLRESVRARRAEERDIERVAAVRTREDKRANEQVIRGNRETLGRVSNAVGSLARSGIGLAAGVMQGAGLDMSLPSLIGKNVNLSQIATNVTNSGFIAKGGRATSDDVNATISAIKKAGDATSTDYGEMAQALDAYNSVTGNLDESKGMLESIGQIAKATGSNVVELAMAGGKLSKDLGDVPDKGRRVNEMLRLIAEQGALGSVEIKDLAQYMGRVSSNAFMFEGSRESVIGKLGAMAQISMLGGRVDAAEATNAVARFGSQMGNENVQKNIRSVMGKDYEFYADKGKTKFKDPEVLISEMVSKAAGDQDKLAAMFKNVMSKSVIEGFTSIYSQAGGGAAGEKAIHDTFKRFSTSMSEGDMQSAFNLSKNTDASKMIDANNRLAEAAMKLVPALESLVPAFVKATSWISENLGVALTAAVGATIAKAAIGDAIKNALSGALSGAGGAGAATGTGGLGNLGKAGLILSVAAVTIAAGVAMIDAEISNLQKANDSSLSKQLEGGNAAQDLEAKAREGTLTSGDLARYNDDLAAMEGRVAKGKDWRDTSWMLQPVLGLSDEQASAKADSKNIPELEARVAQMQGARTRVAQGSIEHQQELYQNIRAQMGGATPASATGDGAKALTDAAATFKAAGFEGVASALMASANQLSTAAAVLSSKGGGGGGADPGGRH